MKKILTLITVVISFASIANADIPNKFTDGQKTSAAQMNENFSTLAVASNENLTSIESSEIKIAELAAASDENSDLVESLELEIAELTTASNVNFKLVESLQIKISELEAKSSNQFKQVVDINNNDLGTIVFEVSDDKDEFDAILQFKDYYYYTEIYAQGVIFLDENCTGEIYTDRIPRTLYLGETLVQMENDGLLLSVKKSEVIVTPEFFYYADNQTGACLLRNNDYNRTYVKTSVSNVELPLGVEVVEHMKEYDGVIHTSYEFNVPTQVFFKPASM